MEIPIPEGFGFGAEAFEFAEAVSGEKKKKRRKKKKKDAEKETSKKATGNPFLVELTGQKNVYPLQDRKNELRGATVNLKFYWDMMPMTALMYMTETERAKGGVDSVVMPKAYF